jgi:protein SCO1/2
MTAKPSPPARPSGLTWTHAAIGVGLVVLAVAGGFLARNVLTPPAATAAASDCRGRAFAEIGGPFSLVDTAGNPFTDRDLLGRPALIYFGFTYCPDICPMSLQVMAQALAQAGPEAASIRPVLISLDPERDSPAAMASYVASSGFPPGLTGLTGTPEQIAAAAKAYRVGFRKVTPEGASSYVIDHSSITYLVDSKGKLATFFSGDTTPDAMAQCLRDLLADGL